MWLKALDGNTTSVILVSPIPMPGALLWCERKPFLGEMLSILEEQLGHTLSVMIFWESRVREWIVPLL